MRKSISRTFETNEIDEVTNLLLCLFFPSLFLCVFSYFLPFSLPMFFWISFNFVPFHPPLLLRPRLLCSFFSSPSLPVLKRNKNLRSLNALFPRGISLLLQMGILGSDSLGVGGYSSFSYGAVCNRGLMGTSVLGFDGVFPGLYFFILVSVSFSAFGRIVYHQHITSGTSAGQATSSAISICLVSGASL
jgi:hypothetical protein